MKLIVNPHKIEIYKDQAINEKEIDISKCEFEFADEITNEYVKEAYFTFKGESYKQIIVNNQCSFPSEVLVSPGTVEIGVVAYLVEDETEIKRYNPSPAYFKTDLGSLRTAQNSQQITPSEMEQYEQALQDGLSEVNDKLDAMDTALGEVDNLDIDANKVGTTTTVTITDKNGSTKEVQILDGETGPSGRDGTDGITPTIGNNGNWYLGTTDTGKPSRGIQGETGQTGPAGQDGTSPTASVSKSGSTATITITDKNGTTTTTINDGTNGTNGRDGYVQYTAGDNITIENNVISATGGSSMYLGALGDFSSSNRLDLSKLDVGLYYLMKDDTAYGDCNFYLKAIKDNVESTLNCSIYATNGVNARTITLEVLKKIEDVTGNENVAIITLIEMAGSSYYNIKQSMVYINYNDTASSDKLTKASSSSNNFNIVSTDTSQTISGLKTFSTLPESSVVPTTDNQLVNKKYVDDNAGGGSTGLPFVLIDTGAENTATRGTYNFNADGKTALGNAITTYNANFIMILRFSSVGYADQRTFILTPAIGGLNDAHSNKYIFSCKEWYYYGSPRYNLYLDSLDVTINGSWNNDVFTCSSATAVGVDNSGNIIYTRTQTNDNFLNKANTTSYTPTSDYHPCTKLYADSVSSPVVTTSSTSTYTIASLTGNNTYKLGEINSLTITAVTTFDKESVIYFESGSTPTDISIPDSLTNLGDVPTLTTSGGVSTGTCTASKNYIISVLNNIAIWKEY